MPRIPATFTDLAGRTGHEGDTVAIPVFDEAGFPQLALAEVVEVLVRDPDWFEGRDRDVRTRRGDEDTRIHAPHEVVVMHPGHQRS